MDRHALKKLARAVINADATAVASSIAAVVDVNAQVVETVIKLPQVGIV